MKNQHSNKPIRSAPVGINDWWNNVDTTISPRVREQNEVEPRPFTRQECEEAMDDLYENGFQ